MYAAIPLSKKMRTAAIFTVALSLIVSGDVLAQVSGCTIRKCTGGTPVLHSNNGYSFETSSIVYPMSGTGRVVYQTCVENKSDRDFEIKWYIPGPDSWLLRDCALKNPRQRIKQDTLNGYAGCLQYGNEWFPERAEFVPHRSDLRAIEDEERKDCRQVIAEEPRRRASDTISGNERIESADLRTPVSEELEAFAPFDPKKPDATMLHIVAHVSLEPSENLKTFKHTVRWDIAKAYETGPPYDGDLLVSPDNAIIREVYQRKFGTGPAAALPVNPKEPITAEFDMPDHPDLGSVRYRFLLANGVPVASIFVPMWLPSQ
jgi:hypothetical protein